MTTVQGMPYWMIVKKTPQPDSRAQRNLITITAPTPYGYSELEMLSAQDDTPKDNYLRAYVAFREPDEQGVKAWQGQMLASFVEKLERVVGFDCRTDIHHAEKTLMAGLHFRLVDMRHYPGYKDSYFLRDCDLFTAPRWSPVPSRQRVSEFTELVDAIGYAALKAQVPFHDAFVWTIQREAEVSAAQAPQEVWDWIARLNGHQIENDHRSEFNDLQSNPKNDVREERSRKQGDLDYSESADCTCRTSRVRRQLRRRLTQR